MCAVPNVAVFRSSLTSCFPGMLLTYFLNDFEIVPVAPISTGITFVFTFHMRYISIVRSLNFRIFSASFLITLLSPEIATSIYIHVPFSLSRIIMSGLCIIIMTPGHICRNVPANARLFTVQTPCTDLTIYNYFARIISFVTSTGSTNSGSCVSRFRACTANLLVRRMCLQHRTVDPASTEVYQSQLWYEINSGGTSLHKF